VVVAAHITVEPGVWVEVLLPRQIKVELLTEQLVIHLLQMLQLILVEVEALVVEMLALLLLQMVVVAAPA
jgi:hypothetical protein